MAKKETKKEVEVTPESEATASEDTKPTESAETKVTFTLVGGKQRIFTLEDHGEDFVSAANEFAETNKAIILNRADE